MSNFYVGQKVVCISDDWDQRAFPETNPAKGCIYTVRDKKLYPDGFIGIHLKEIINQPYAYIDGFGEVWFDASKFRPVVTRPTSIEIFRSLLTNTEQENRRQLEVKEHERAETALFDPFTETPWQRPFQ